MYGAPVRIDLHIHLDGDDRIDEILRIVRLVRTDQGVVMADLTRLTAEVTETRTVVDSAIALLNQLAQLLRDSADDPAAINALADQLDADQADLAAAVAANTPAEPTP